ncbi:MAG: hypothetical protein LV481_06690 [Methylacidiphilales bacterium]|nr:hypothetical protein [Candidatus Methylacidiphilales bacterium]
MKTPTILSLAWYTLLGAILSLSSPAFADASPLILQAQDELHQALDASGPPPNIDDKTKHLKSALDLLQQSAPVYRGQRAKAIEFVKAALLELGKDDPNLNKVDDYIENALDEIRSIT